MLYNLGVVRSMDYTSSDHLHPYTLYAHYYDTLYLFAVERLVRIRETSHREAINQARSRKYNLVIVNPIGISSYTLSIKLRSLHDVLRRIKSRWQATFWSQGVAKTHLLQGQRQLRNWRDVTGHLVIGAAVNDVTYGRTAVLQRKVNHLSIRSLRHCLWQ